MSKAAWLSVHSPGSYSQYTIRRSEEPLTSVFDVQHLCRAAKIKYRDCKFVEKAQAEAKAAIALTIIVVYELADGLLLCLLHRDKAKWLHSKRTRTLFSIPSASSANWHSHKTHRPGHCPYPLNEAHQLFGRGVVEFRPIEQLESWDERRREGEKEHAPEKRNTKEARTFHAVEKRNHFLHVMFFVEAFGPIQRPLRSS